MKCPKCGHEFKSPVAVAGGKAGGAAKVAKGFASPAVMRKALATRRRNQKACRHNAGLEPRGNRVGSESLLADSQDGK